MSSLGFNLQNTTEIIQPIVPIISKLFGVNFPQLEIFRVVTSGIASLGCITFIPQIISNYRTRETKALSMISLISKLLVSTSFLLYTTTLNSEFSSYCTMANAMIGLTSLIIIIGQKIHYEGLNSLSCCHKKFHYKSANMNDELENTQQKMI